MTKQIAYIGLGSNLQNPIEQVKQVLLELEQLPSTQLLRKSSLYRSDSLLDGQEQYINAVACLETLLTPLELLDALQQIELQHGRERHERWGARTLDLDIILYADQVIKTERLTVPHYQMAVRSFVLAPLMEVAGDIILPSGEQLSSLLVKCPHQNLEKLALIE